jgi:hypothetical protein
MREYGLGTMIIFPLNLMARKSTITDESVHIGWTFLKRFLTSDLTGVKGSYLRSSMPL